ncbi:hypothetical protein FDT66_02645 [Polaribacter aestuariivivens]|uniref:Uncharacterized protein n=1 Tax=Polaribacter aestuariivivens TaxID=2304626 RepID=A0A5S3NB84_9FLAO|nr:TatD family hydrolase [Polaribacter aestuariivivens]TMM32382.1 hypothetical protein FDT66_02645 [Polaribacter aestuariivivens]
MSLDFINIHTHKKIASKNVFSIENKYPNSQNFSHPFSIGIHPWFINKNSIDEELHIIENKIIHENCYALGECGLDKLIEIDFKLQKEVFIKQIQVSEKHKKPLIIHCVKAFQEIIEIKKELKPKQTWIVHGFNKNFQIADNFIKNNILISFGEAIIKNEKLQKVVEEISIDNFFLETDDSEVDIETIYQKTSIIKHIEMEELQQKIKNNFKKIFNT